MWKQEEKQSCKTDCNRNNIFAENKACKALANRDLEFKDSKICMYAKNWNLRIQIGAQSCWHAVHFLHCLGPGGKMQLFKLWNTSSDIFVTGDKHKQVCLWDMALLSARMPVLCSSHIMCLFPLNQVKKAIRNLTICRGPILSQHCTIFARNPVWLKNLGAPILSTGMISCSAQCVLCTICFPFDWASWDVCKNILGVINITI